MRLPDPPRPSPESVDASVNALAAPLAQILPALVAGLPALLAEVRQQLSAEWPDYAQFMADEHGTVAAAAESFMHWLVHIAKPDLTGLPAQTPLELRPQMQLFEEIGRVQCRQGRDVSTLLSAYQVGARAAWHYVSHIALSARVPPESLAALAEAVFVFIDQLSSASAHGYMAEQAEAGAARERLRDELVELLQSDRADMGAIRTAAARVGWQLPREASVVLVEPTNPVGRAILSRLDDSHLVIHRAGVPVGVIVPDPVGPGRRKRLTGALRGAGAVVGPPVALTRFPLSVHVAELAAQLHAAGVLLGDPIFAEDHLDAIIVHHDAELLEALRQQALAPLSGLAPAAQQRLSETLDSWLRHMGDRQAIAAELHIHPQTVRYRMAQLHELFGADLDDPRCRARMTLALAWQHPIDRSGRVPPGRPLGDTA